MIEPANDRTAGGCCILIAAALLIGSLLWMVCIARCHAELPAPLEGLLARLEAPGTPAWKAALIPRIRERRIGRFMAQVTIYCPNSPADPLGGGAFGAWSFRGKDIPLRRGHCAVGTTVRAAPFGSVLYCPAVVDCLQIVVDKGPGVNGKDRIDICEPNEDRYFALDWANWKRFPCWRLGTVEWEDAR